MHRCMHTEREREAYLIYVITGLTQSLTPEFNVPEIQFISFCCILTFSKNFNVLHVYKEK